MARVLGTEIEYGIAAPGDADASPIFTSTQAVLSYAKAHAKGQSRRARWDYEPESPLRDSRGFDLRRYRQTPVVDPDALGAANIITDNGARFYVDHAHPEYSAPETTDPLEAVIVDRAGDHIMLEAAKLASAEPDCPQLKIYRNNVDGKGASYGTHENYRFRRDTNFDDIITGLTPFFVTRQVFCGAGRVGLGEKGQHAGFQISQRADYIETEVSLETTLNRGIINTRDEPHADPDQWRRLHVIIGDANMSETATFLKLGATSLVLDAIEAGVDFSDLALRDPVSDVRKVSRDLSCTEKLQHEDHVTWRTAVEIQYEYLNRVAEFDTHGTVVSRWREVLDLLAKDPMSTSGILDWTAKLSLLEGLRSRGNLGWDHPKLALIDLQYSDIDPDRGLYHALVARGRMRRLTDDETVARAVHEAPTSTRAYLRGGLLRRFPADIVAASWDSTIVNVGDTDNSGAPTDPNALVKLSLHDVEGLGADAVADIVENAETIGDVVGGLCARGLAGLRPHDADTSE
ncbi:proteasome accessory factor PafA2 [Corynebacterium sp. TAE3-ERU12]|uniref:depupylase/deamidase Dop n=1 Tax=Corynebacterium sp. TAE3-ERU12 TaxID=2849491 RepID=UPI001C452CF2|nr:proteasome accessory factor PafA2 [Corynebacterium sp. TAE3-ERU12]